MKLERVLSEAEAKKVQSLILFGGVFTTLAIWTKLEDPVNLPKMFVLVLFGAGVLGLSLPALLRAPQQCSGNQKVGLALIGLFLIGLVIATLATDVKYTAIFGEYHRNNGAISYIAMITFMVGCVLSYTYNFDKRYFLFLGGTGFIVSIYGVLQGLGKDPIGWVALYNPFITTLGNPNFTSGFLGLAAIATFYSLLSSNLNKVRLLHTTMLVFEIYVLIKTSSIQGIFAFAIGITVIVLTKIWLLNSKVGIGAIIVAAVLALPAALALFNIGPLAERIFQSTLNNRVDYWKAALAMFKENMFTGVGIDRYGEFYRQYAVQFQFVQGQVTDNAHSLYLQILATGGLVTFIPFLTLLSFITLVALRNLLRSTGQEKLHLSGLLGIWIATLTLNLVTIDNLGVGIWLWILGGIIISKSHVENHSLKMSNKKSSTMNSGLDKFPSPNLLAMVLVVSVLSIMVPILNKSESLFHLKNNGRGLNSAKFQESVSSENDKSGADVQRRIQILNIALIRGYSKESFAISDEILSRDPRSFYGNLFTAYAYEREKNYKEAVLHREVILKLDPWNTSNMLQLMKNYIALGEKAKASSIASKINENYPGSAADIEASTLLAG